MIYLELWIEGIQVNRKLVERLYAMAGLQIRRRKRKNVPVATHHPLVRPMAANPIWSIDFVFDRSAEGVSPRA